MTAEEVLTTIARDRLHVHPLEYPREVLWMVCRHGLGQPRFEGPTLPAAVAAYLESKSDEDFLE